MIFSNLDEKSLQNLATQIAKNLDSTQFSIHLSGDLGAGKTTFARSFIQNFGFEKVKSPTYSIVEPYENNNIKIYHFDLYRLCDFEELEMIGVREYFDNICLIEWADNFTNELQTSDLLIKLSGIHTRNAEIISNTKRGEKLLKSL